MIYEFGCKSSAILQILKGIMEKVPSEVDSLPHYTMPSNNSGRSSNHLVSIITAETRQFNMQQKVWFNLLIVQKEP